jgi:hypothetical protein
VSSNIETAQESTTITPISQKAKLAKQLEFYLGDNNLMQDKFLAELIAKNRKH